MGPVGSCMVGWEGVVSGHLQGEDSRGLSLCPVALKAGAVGPCRTGGILCPGIGSWGSTRVHVVACRLFHQLDT